MDHCLYDKRNYPMVEVREVYGEWVQTCEQTVQDEMDLGRANIIDTRKGIMQRLSVCIQYVMMSM